MVSSNSAESSVDNSSFQVTDTQGLQEQVTEFTISVQGEHFTGTVSQASDSTSGSDGSAKYTVEVTLPKAAFFPWKQKYKPEYRMRDWRGAVLDDIENYLCGVGSGIPVVRAGSGDCGEFFCGHWHAVRHLSGQSSGEETSDRSSPPHELILSLE